jgi:hypothetical protein
MFKAEVYKMLSFFADNKEHRFAEIMNLSAFTFKYKSWRTSEQLMTKSLLANGLVYRCWKEYSPQLDAYQLTSKGDACFRDYQIWRISCENDNSEAKRYFKYFNRETEGRFGVEGMDKKISELDAINHKAQYSEEYYRRMLTEPQ